jgi:hypothetical protein
VWDWGVAGAITGPWHDPVTGLVHHDSSGDAQLWVLASFSLEGFSVFNKAQDEAIRVHRDMGTGQLLLGLIKDYNGIASIVLRLFRVTVEDARVMVDADGSDGGHCADDSDLGYTQPVRRLLDQSLKEAQRPGAWVY